MRDHDHPVLDRHTDQSNKTDGRRHIQRHTPDIQGQHTTEKSQRNDTHHQSGLAEFTAGGKQQQQHNTQCQRNHCRQTVIGTVLVLELSRPLQVNGIMVIVHFFIDQAVSLVQELGQVYATQVDMDGQVAPVHLAGDGTGSGRHLHLCHLREGDLCTCPIRKQQVTNTFGRVTAGIVETADHIITFTSDEYLRDRLPTDCQLDHIGYIGEVKAILRDTVAVGDDLQLRKWRFLVDSNIGSSGDRTQHIHHLIGDMAGIGDIIAIYLYGQVAMCTGNLIHYHVNDRLREADGITRHSRKLFRHFLDQVGLCLAELPGIVRFQTDSAFDMGKGESFGSLIVTPDLGHYIGDFFKLFHCFTQLGSHLLRLLYGDTRRQLHLYPDRSLVERRQEVFSYRITQYTGSHQDNE